MNERATNCRDAAIGAALRGQTADAAAWAGGSTELFALYRLSTEPREKLDDEPVTDSTFVDPRKRKKRINGQARAE